MCSCTVTFNVVLMYIVNAVFLSGSHTQLQNKQNKQKKTNIET